MPVNVATGDTAAYTNRKRATWVVPRALSKTSRAQEEHEENLVFAPREMLYFKDGQVLHEISDPSYDNLSY